MKTIGILGGMSWESTREYYRQINEGIREKLGGLHSAEILMSSVDFGPISAAMNEGNWDFVERSLTDRARRLAAAGADLLLIATNTMHKLADSVASAAAPAKLIHIGDCVAAEASRRGLTKVILMGTRFTMEEGFYASRLRDAGIEVVVPEEEARRRLDGIIFSELCVGIFRSESRTFVTNVVSEAKEAGAEAIVLGCTELPLILTPEKSPLPVLDTMGLHSAAAVAEAVS